MSAKKKRGIPAQYRRQLLQFVDAFIAEQGAQVVDMRTVASWAIKKGLWLPPRGDVVKQLARDLSRAARQDYIEDENGEPVRHRHAYTIKEGDGQQTLWFNLEDGTPQQVKLSAQQRRKGILADCVQLARDVKFYDKNYNPGDPIKPSFNFEPDLAEKEEPTEYDDTPPGEPRED